MFACRRFMNHPEETAVMTLTWHEILKRKQRVRVREGKYATITFT